MSIKEEKEAAAIQLKALALLAGYAEHRAEIGFEQLISSKEQEGLRFYLEGMEEEFGHDKVTPQEREALFALLALVGE